MNYYRLVQWGLTVFFSMLPLLWTVLLHVFTASLTWDVLAESPEILFMGIMVSAAAGNDAIEATQTIGGFHFLIAGVSLFLIAMFAAGVYGFFLFDHFIANANDPFSSRLLIFSLVLALITTAGSTILEIQIARGEGGQL